MRRAQISGIIGNVEFIRPNNSEYIGFKFSVANNDETKKEADGSFRRITSWFDLIYWTKNEGHWSLSIKKGNTIAADCEMKQNTWQAADGTNRSNISFTVQGFPIIAPKPNQGQQAPQQQGASQQAPPQQSADDDLIF